MTKHTPEPWNVNKYGSIGAGARGVVPIIATIEPFYGPDEVYGSHSENARRIVSCINALAGIETAHIEYACAGSSARQRLFALAVLLRQAHDREVEEELRIDPNATRVP